jgi:predicted O-methyltransferase YrrM
MLKKRVTKYWRFACLTSMVELTQTLIAGGSDDAQAFHLCRLVASTYTAGIPRIPLEVVLASLDTSYSERKVLLHPLLRGHGSGAASEIAALAALVAAKRPQRIVEFGTYDGFSTWHLWSNSSEATEIVTVDLPAGAKVLGSSDSGFQGVTERPYLPKDPRIRLVEIDSRRWKADVDGVDLCYIDAGHTYECAKNDSQIAFRIVRAGGIVIWHDSTWRGWQYGVNKYLRELRTLGLNIQLISLGPFDYCSLAFLLVAERAERGASGTGGTDLGGSVAG